MKLLTFHKLLRFCKADKFLPPRRQKRLRSLVRGQRGSGALAQLGEPRQVGGKGGGYGAVVEAGVEVGQLLPCTDARKET